MFALSKDTTINKGVSDDSAENALRECIVKMRNGREHQFITIQSGVNDDWFVLGLGDGPFANVKPFLNPIKFDYGDDTYIIIDLRTSTRFDRNAEKPVISNPGLFRRDTVRVLLEQAWVGDGADSILRFGHFQVQIFAAWMSSLFGRRYALDAEQTMKINILAAFYYLCLFTREELLDQRRFIAIIAKVTHVGAPYVIETLRDIDYIGNIEDLLKNIINTLQTDRLEGLAIDVMITMLGGSWFGPNAAIMVGIALEYPPMWNTLLYLSLTEQVNRSTGIGKVALSRERESREYVSIVSQFLTHNSTIDKAELKGAR